LLPSIPAVAIITGMSLPLMPGSIVPSARLPHRAVLGTTTLLGLLAALLATSSLADTARARRGMVVAEDRIAADMGAAVLRDGGNAVDAAVATAFSLSVTHPAAGNLGGGGFLLYREPSGKAVAYDFRETAPARAHAQMFLDDGLYDEARHHRQHLAVGVPGTVAGLHLAWTDAGSLPWERLVGPAIELAERGFVISPTLALSLSNALPKLRGSPAALAQFSRDGRPYAPGELLKQPDLAHSLRLIRDQGPRGFYHGEVAERIEQEMRRHGGWITRADLAGYAAKLRLPVRGQYREYEVLSMPPPSSGGVVLLLMLNILEGTDPADPGLGAPDTVHWLAEAMRRGFAERALHLGDPDFNPGMPVDRLISKEYADELRRTIRPGRASVSATNRFSWPVESDATTHLSVVDAQRNAVALTYTLEESYGSGIMAPGTGFLLNNEMGDFNAAPGLTATHGLIGTAPNLAAPHKRMLSSMSPTILTRDGRVFLVLGSPGGRSIINTVLQVILNVVDHRMELPDAVAALRVHHQWLPDRIQFERGALTPPSQAELARRGHALVEQESPQGAVMAIRLHAVQDELEGVADPRAGDGGARGW
jgi:gamma-glutamyltranspeptidase / glutathione hydrolase